MGTKDDVRGLKAELDKFATDIRDEIAKVRAMKGEQGPELMKRLHGLQNLFAEYKELNKELDGLFEGSNSAFASADELSPTKADSNA